MHRFTKQAQSKRIFAGILALSLVTVPAYATLSPSASPTVLASPASNPEEISSPQIVETNSNRIIALNDSGEDVLRIQQRLIELEYFAFKCTGSFGGMTRQALINFQSLNGIMADGTAGEETQDLLFSKAADNLPIRNPIPAAVKMPIGSSTTAGDVPPVLGEQADWFEVIDKAMALGESFTVTDLTDQKTFSVIRTGGINHARIETASATDTQTFLSVFGGEYNWSKRPVIVDIGNIQYAASLQGMPAGDDQISSNGMGGSCALYFWGSLSDISGLPDVEHRYSVSKATSASYWQ